MVGQPARVVQKSTEKSVGNLVNIMYVYEQNLSKLKVNCGVMLYQDFVQLQIEAAQNALRRGSPDPGFGSNFPLFS
jgi:hypothetical protein